MRSIPTVTTAFALLGVAAAVGHDRTRAGSALAPADTVSVESDWIASVTMEPIRVLVSDEQRLESVTMEPIRVVIPSGADAPEKDATD